MTDEVLEPIPAEEPPAAPAPILAPPPPPKVLYTIIVAADYAPLARELATAFAGDAGSGMWVRGVCPVDAADETPTAFISSGDIEDHFGDLMGDAAAIHAGAPDVPLQMLEAMVATNIVVRHGDPAAVMAEHGLRFCVEEAV